MNKTGQIMQFLKESLKNSPFEFVDSKFLTDSASFSIVDMSERRPYIIRISLAEKESTKLDETCTKN